MTDSVFSTTTEAVMEESHSLFELIMTPVITVIFMICAIVLFCMIIHLTRATIKQWKSHDKGIANEVYLFLIGTIIGVSSFAISLVCTIIVTTQMFLMDHVMKRSVISPDFFFASYPTLQYLIAIFDSIGHLLSLFIFIARFDCVFKISIFHQWQSRKVVHFMYIMLIILIMILLVIMFYIFPFETDTKALLSWEIAWELCVEFMIVFVLILFVSRLYHLLKFVLPKRIQHHQRREFVANITAQTSMEFTQEIDPNASTMTIDGVPVFIDSNKIPQFQANVRSPIETQALDLLSLISKLTVLVIVSAVASFLSIIGNLVIETHSTFNAKNIITHDAIWVFILPVIDILCASFMIYLQFGFTRMIYYKMCNCLDRCFLKCMLSAMFCCSGMTQLEDLSFFLPTEVNSNPTSVELHTTSPQSNELRLNYPDALQLGSIANNNK